MGIRMEDTKVELSESEEEAILDSYCKWAFAMILDSQEGEGD